MRSTLAVPMLGALVALWGCNPQQPSARHVIPSPRPTLPVVYVELHEGQQLERADMVGDVVAVHLHKTGAIQSDWKGPAYTMGPGLADGGTAPQVPYPEPAKASVADRYYAFRAKEPGIVGIGFVFPVSCPDGAPCMPEPALLTLRISGSIRDPNFPLAQGTFRHTRLGVVLI